MCIRDSICPGRSSPQPTKATTARARAISISRRRKSIFSLSSLVVYRPANTNRERKSLSFFLPFYTILQLWSNKEIWSSVKFISPFKKKELFSLPSIQYLCAAFVYSILAGSKAAGLSRPTFPSSSSALKSDIRIFVKPAAAAAAVD